MVENHPLQDLLLCHVLSDRSVRGSGISCHFGAVSTLSLLVDEHLTARPSGTLWSNAVLSLEASAALPTHADTGLLLVHLASSILVVPIDVFVVRRVQEFNWADMVSFLQHFGVLLKSHLLDRWIAISLLQRTPGRWNVVLSRLVDLGHPDVHFGSPLLLLPFESVNGRVNVVHFDHVQFGLEVVHLSLCPFLASVVSL